MKIIEALFGDAPPSPDEPSVDALFDYASALLAGDDVASRFPAVHRYVEQSGDQDDHYQALLVMLRLERTGKLESPPPARFEFSAGPSPVPSTTATAPWRVEFGQLIINLGTQMLAAFTPAPQVAYQRSAGDQTLLEWAFTEESSGVAIKVTARAASSTAERCNLVVGVGLPNRRWPKLSGIPVSLTTDPPRVTAQATDAFGKTVFQAVPVAMLSRASIRVGPLAELAGDQP